MIRRRSTLCLALLFLFSRVSFAAPDWFELKGLKFGMTPSKEMKRIERIGEPLSSYLLENNGAPAGSPLEFTISCRFIYDRLAKIDLFFPAVPHAAIDSMREKYDFGPPLYYGDIVSDLFSKLEAGQSLRDESGFGHAARKLSGAVASGARLPPELSPDALGLDLFFSGVAIPESGPLGSAHGEIFYRNGVLMTVRECPGGCVVSFSDVVSPIPEYFEDYKKSAAESLK